MKINLIVYENEFKVSIQYGISSDLPRCSISVMGSKFEIWF